ncbi:MAG: DUF58 domain-containing protein [Verrucomicrobiota bacterium]
MISASSVSPVHPLPPLDLQLLADLPTLALQARYLVDGFLSGRHRSPQKGSSVEFAEYRDYQFGDDLRRVDWRLFGRTDRLHVKQFEEESQLRVFLVLDASASMDFKSSATLMSKLEFARLTLAAVGALAQKQGDSFGLGIVGVELVDFLRSRATTSHWQTFIGKLQTVQPQGQTALAQALESLAEIIPPRSLIVVASDFYEEPAALQSALRRLRYDHHDIIGAQVLDPLELDFNSDVAGTFVDAENGSRMRLDAPAVRRGYLERFQRFCLELDTMFRDAGGDLVQLRTDQPPLAALSEYLAKREERTR